jgi:hypothetical protein
MSKLLIFPTPLDAECVLVHDSGFLVHGKPDSHPSGRPGQSFRIPEGTPDGQGCLLLVTAPKKVPIQQRGILYLASEPFIAADDFYLMDEKVCPPCPEPPPLPPPQPPLILPGPGPWPSDPLGIIQKVYRDGHHDLSTKEGCGQFTEACCTELHNRHSLGWGHVKKMGAQNNYNGHAVDAIQYHAGIYDIITSSESPQARPAFNRAGDFRPDLWYYPA